MPTYNNAQIRKWLLEFFNIDEDFDFFVEDNFPEVFAQFSSDMSLNKKSRLVTKYCEDKGQIDHLLSLVETEDPDKFAGKPPPAPLDDGDSVAETPAVETSPAPDSPPETPAADAADVPDQPSPNNEVFISYSRRDLDFVTQLHEELTRRGVTAWFDKFNIQVADHWRTSIATGIRDCKVFVLVMSPDSMASVNVRKEVDLAERHKKQIIPLMWRKSDIPPAMEYQLAGIQYIDFAETASEGNFAQIAEVLRRLVGGASFVEAASSSEAVKAAPVPAIEKEPAAASSGGRSGRTLRGKSSLGLSPIAVGGRVTSSVITTFGLNLDQQDEMGRELKWLFSAADHTLKIQSGEADADTPIPVPIPPNVQVLSGANDNKITHPAHAAGQARQISDVLKRIKKRLDTLDELLVRNADLGEAAINDRMLQSEIKGNRVAIVEDMKVLSAGIEQAYEIRVEAPDLLLDYLEQA